MYDREDVSYCMDGAGFVYR